MRLIYLGLIFALTTVEDTLCGTSMCSTSLICCCVEYLMPIQLGEITSIELVLLWDSTNMTSEALVSVKMDEHLCAHP